jgi:predicted MFS family arabinose efflux permease
MALAVAPTLLWPTLTALLASRLAVGAGEGVMMSATVLWLLRLTPAQRRGRALGHIGLANFAGLALGPLLATALGGARAASAVLGAALALPLAGAAAALALQSPRRAAAHGATAQAQPRALLCKTARPGAALLLVNVGYVAVLSFGPGAGAPGALVVPVFAMVVIAARTLGGAIPDRLGGRRTVLVFAGAEAVGLLVSALAPAPAVALAALVALAVDQALAVPGLGLLALAGVPAARQGAAAGLFFAWFDAGVGLGGPATGAVAALAGARGALVAAALAVGAAVVAVRPRGVARRDRRRPQAA